MNRTFLVFDGWNVFLRHYLGNPTMDINGEAVGGVVGFIKNLKSLIEQFKPAATYVVWDGEGGSERRRSIRSEYKAGRKVRLNREYDFGTTAEEEHANMRRQRELVGEYLDIIGIPQIVPRGVEADDAVAYLCHTVLEEGASKVIVSNDRDMLQLVGVRGVKVFNHRKKRLMDSEAVLEDVGVPPENYAVMKAVCGDDGDNVKGVKGVGPKTLVKLCPALRDRLMTLPEVLDHIESVASGGKSVTARKVVDLGRGTIQENMRLVDLSSPLMSPDSARHVRAVAFAQKGFNAAGVRFRAMKDGIQLSESLDGVFRQQALRRSLWLSSLKKEEDV